MSEPMTLERFEHLADAYGGVVARWPQDVRDAARTMATKPEAILILARASALDEALDAWTIPVASEALRERVSAAMPAPSRDILRRARLWWSGVGLAAAVAGAAVGVAAVAMLPPADAPPGLATSFGDIGPQER